MAGLKRSPASGHSLWALTAKAGLAPERFIADPWQKIALYQLAGGTSLGIDVSQFSGRSVLLHFQRQLPVALALLELDGIASRLVLCPPDLALAQFPAVIEKAGIDIIVTDEEALADHAKAVRIVSCGLPMTPGEARIPDRDTEWLLFTSGTTGTPKMVRHSLQTLTGPMRGTQAKKTASIWSTFYDIRRYGGLQILLRALTGGSSMLLSDADEKVEDFLKRMGKAGVRQISGTPSHWRRALMSPSMAEISPNYVRLSGEIADQNILNNLRAVFPAASISHAFASTEAGVVFDVRDGLAGFPISWISRSNAGMEIRVKDGSLHICSAYTSKGYAGEQTLQLKDAEGFVDTGDMVVVQGERYHFAGRREGIINVGGLKVHPEEVEAIINLHPSVRISRVKARSSPITGAIVVADIVLKNQAGASGLSLQSVQDEIFNICRQNLPAHKVPALLREVPSLEITAAGKLLRHRA